MNKKLILTMICLVACVIMSLSAVSAGDDASNMTMSADDSQPDIHQEEISSNDEDVLKESPGTFTELNNIIQAANDGDRISLNKSYAYDEAQDSALVGGIVFTKNNIEIDGNGFTLDGAHKARIFYVGGGSQHDFVDGVVLRNINFVNAYSNEQNKDLAFGAVAIRGNATVEYCNFSNNSAHCAAALGLGYSTNARIDHCNFINNTGFGQGGGAIRLKTGVYGLTISNSVFRDNHGASYGGAVHSDMGSGNLNTLVDNCYFINNDAATGAGALFFETAGGVVRNSRFENNTAPLGGAIYWNGVSGSVTSSNFTHNIAGDKGGAIYTSNRSTTNITASNFRFNIAELGGAIYFDNTQGSAIETCTFKNNTANSNGGAIYVAGTFFKLINSNFTGDLAKYNGGSLYLDVGAYVYMCNFNSETAKNDGGGIYLLSKNVLDISQLPPNTPLGVFSTNFTGCHADHDGGAGYVYSNYGVVKDAILKDCTAGGDGGAGYIKGNFGQLIDSQLINNTAKMNGGALYWEGNNGTITNTRYRLNKVIEGNGGGIYWQGSNGNITDCNFTIHIAGPRSIDVPNENANGGALYWQGNNGSIRHCDFDKSTAKGNGAAVYVSGNNTNITDSTFMHYNSTNASGGALYIEGNNVEIVETTFDMGGAAKDGGAVYIKGSNVHIHDSTISHNYAGQHGGSVYIEGDDAIIVDSMLMLTYTYSGYGGSVYIKGHRTSIEHSNFSNSSSKQIEGASTLVKGGAIYIEGDDTNITNAMFQFATATSGGAIYIEGDNTRVLHSNFTRLGSSRSEMNQSGIAADALGGAIYVAGNDTVISHAYFNQTNSGNGGAIYLAGDRTKISNVMFDSHRAINGGAIYVAGNDANITDFSVMHLIVDANGGAIYVAGNDTVISNGDFSQSSADKGGAIYVEGDRTEISHTTFQRMGVQSAGGAIYIEGDDTNITDASFTYLNITGDGGAIYIGGKGTQISQAEFGFLYATRGGAIFIEGNDTVIESNFHHCFAVNTTNSASAGGAIYVEGSGNEIRNSNFQITNAIGGNGGAIYAGGANTVISNIHINIANAIRNGPGNRGSGGAIYIEGDGAKVLDSEFVIYNATGKGGALFIEGDDAYVNNSVFNKSSANLGGSIYVKGANADIEYSSFHMGFANHGAAIYIEGSNTHVLHSDFKGLGAIINQSNINTIHSEDLTNVTLGGAIYVAGDDTLISFNTFNQTNAGHGGAIYVAGERTEISHTSFTRHNAVRGGAIYVTGNDTNIIDSLFTMAFVTHDGGAIYLGGLNAHISSSTFTLLNATRGGAIFIDGNESVIESDFSYCFSKSRNDTPSAGGAIYVEGNDNEIRNSNFQITMAFGGNGGAIYAGGLNTTVNHIQTNISRAIRTGPGDIGNGGAIYIAGDSAKVTDSTFTIYNATDNGGALFIAGNDVNITHSNFTLGQANRGGAIYVAGNDTYVEWVNIARNTALRNGGEFYINGNGAVISNANLSYALAMRSGGAVFINGSNNLIKNSNLTYLNASSMYGGGIFINGENNNITDSFFEYCSSTRGGAIYINGTNSRVSYSNFTMVGVSPSVDHNHTDGGAIYISGNNAIVEHDKFYMSSADHGGFIFIEGNDATVSYSNFSNSFAGDAGGAIYITGSDTVIEHSRFQMHNATDGGTIYVNGTGASILHSNFFRTLSENGDGGAIYIEGTGANVVESVFNQTRANSGDGGAIYIEGKNANVSASNFTMVIAENGGVIYIAGDDAIVEHSNFAFSHAIVNGGSIYVAGDNVLIDDSTFLAHNATVGGTIYISGMNADIANSEFTRSLSLNGDGGAIYINGTDASIFKSNFNQTLCRGSNGGAIYIAGEHANVSECTFNQSIAFKNNDNGGNGGVIYIAGDDAIVEHSNFSYSNANVNGGSIYVAGNDVLIDHSSFLAHNATAGGTIYISGSGADINYSHFTRSLSLNGDGGAIYINGTDANVYKSSFNQTRADYNNGGAIYINGSKANISNSNFTHIYARNGAVIYIAGEDAIVEYSIFTTSYAFGDGGAIYIAGENAVVDHSSFAKHNATNGGTIYVEGDNANISNSNFTLSLSHDGHGGAIYIAGDDVDLVASRFEETRADNGDGGVIYVAGDRANISSSSFNKSLAHEGGSIYILGENSTITYSNVSRSNATDLGGAIFVSGNNTKIENSFFERGNANYGGAIYIKGYNVHVHDSNFTSYYARDDGGVFYIKGDSAHIGGSMVEMAYAIGNGGGVYISGKDARVSGSYFTKNMVMTGDGGAIYITGENATVIDSNFSLNNASMNSSSKGGALYIKGVNSHVIDSKFEKSNSNDGAAIYLQGTHATITGSTFNHSNVTGDGGAIYIAGDYALVNNSYFNSSTAMGNGGLIYIKGNYAKISYSNFSRSVSHSFGGAIYIGGSYGGGMNATIEHSRFSYHNATSGGAIYANGKFTKISYSYFEEGHTSITGGSQKGGAVYLNGNDTTIYMSVFNRNLASEGGAICNAGGTARILYSNFTNNTVTGRGGAILWTGGASNDAVIGSYFENNRATTTGASLGGAIFWENGGKTTHGASIINSTFFNNYAGRHGGAIDWFKADDSVIENCSFIQNHANSDGGALYVGDDGDTEGRNLTVINCNFTENYARIRGGAISLQFYNSHVKNSLFINNSASEGGSVFMGNLKAKNSDYVNCTFIGSSTHSSSLYSECGGVAYIKVPDVSFIDCRFYNSSVMKGKQGGAIFFTSTAANGVVDGCEFVNSTNAAEGGAIFSEANNLLINNSNFTSLSVSSSGAAVYLASQNNHIRNSNFTNNNASGYGGAVFIAKSNNEIYNSIFNANYAGLEGGAIFINASDVGIKNSEIHANLAEYGAGIYSCGCGNAIISDTNITNNNATKGSGIYVEKSNYTLVNVKLLENQAHADSFVNKSIGIDENGHYVTAVFTGMDNLLNGIWQDDDSNATGFTGVTYWGASGVETTDSVPELSTAEAGINITVTRNNLRSTAVVKTDKNGTFKYYFDKGNANEVEFGFQHFEDNYYTGLRESASFLATVVTINVGDIDFGENATVNVTLRDIDGAGLNATVSVSINNTYNFTVTVVNGTGSINNVSGLPVGLYNATAVFKGDTRHFESANSTTFRVRPVVNISVVKEPDLDNVTLGTLVNFTITVTNHGPSNATNVTVFDKLPYGLAYVKSGSNITSQGIYAIENGAEVIRWTIGNLTAGESVRLWIQVNTTANGTIGNVAVARSAEGSEKSSNTTNITVRPVVNLGVVKTSNLTGHALVGDLVNFTITVTNNGPSNATNVMIFDELNSAFKFVNASGNIAPVNGKLTWTINELSNGTSISLWVVVKVLTNGTFTNMALANSSETNKTFQNHTTITVDPKVNLTVVKTVNITGNATVGDLVNFTITVTNHGPSNATNVKIVDELIKAFAFVDASGNPDVRGQNVTWTIAHIANGTNVSVWVQVRILTNGTLKNVVSVNSTENYTSTDGEVNIDANPQVNLTVVKTSSVANASVGDLVNFTIVVTNDGLSNATDVNVTDYLPIGMIPVRAGANVTGVTITNVTLANGTVKVVWNVALLNNKTSVSLWLLVNLTVNGTFTNVAFATSKENRTNSTNSTNITVNPVVDLVINKTVDKTNVSVGDNVIYTITVKNNGPSNATGVYVIDKLDKRLKLIDATPGQGSYDNVTGKWIIGNITHGKTVTLTLLVKVLTNGTIPNFANVTGNENDTNKSNNNVSSDNVTVNPKVNLTIIKKADVTNATVGDVINFTITVINHGPSNATNVQISDVLVSAFEFKDANGTYTHAGQKVNWTIAHIANGTSVSVWLTVRVIGNGTLTNVAHVNCTENTTDITSNETNITANPQVNLTVVKTSSVANARVGDLVNFTIVVTNDGLSNATDVNVTDLLPAGMIPVKAGGNVTGVTVTNVTLVNGTVKVVWNIPLLNNKTSVSVWLLVNVTASGNFTNVAFATSKENKTNSTNSTNITVNPVVDLQINKTVDKVNVSVGDNVIYTITVKNNGPSNATGVYVIDKLDKRLELVNAAPGQGSYDNVTGKWTIGNITHGKTVTLTLTVKVLTNGTIPNFANVTGKENDTNKTNNNVSSDNVTVNPKVNLTIIKKADVTNATVGDVINFTITVINHGPSNATNVQISDVLVSAFEFKGANGTYSQAGQKVNWTIAHIANGTSVSVWLTVRIIGNGTLTNVAHVNCTENTTDVTSNETNITANPQVNLTVVKTSSVANASVGDLVNFRIVVTNDGLSNATDVNVTDFLPVGMIPVRAGGNISGITITNMTLSNGTVKVVWNIPLLNNKTSVSVWLLVNVTASGNFTNVAFATSKENRTNSTNSTNITVNPVVDLQINKTVDKTIVSVGDTVIYTITVKNNGPSNASGVYVIDKLDKRLELVNAAPGQGSYDNVTGKWTIGNITHGKTVTLKLTVKVLTNGTIPNFANVTGNENDTNKSNNNVSSDNITVNPKVNLTIIKKANVTNATVGDTITYTITVINNGPSNATNVQISDVLVSAFEFKGANGTYTRTGQKVNWTIAHIANGTNVSVWLTVRIISNGTLTNVAYVNCSENTTDVSSNETNVTANPQVNLTVVKTSSVANASVGDLVNFTIVVTNDGLSNATDVNVTDFLPIGMVPVVAGANVTGVAVSNVTLANGTVKVVWNIPLLTNKTAVSLWLVVNVTASGNFTNVAFASSKENRTNSTNSTNITVNPAVDLAISKTVNKTAVYVNDIVVYTITVTNNGPSNATGVYVIDKLDKRLELISASESSYNNLTGRWDIGKLAKNQTVTLTLTVRVLTNGTIPNFANVTGRENDTNKSNNNVSAQNITVSPKVNLTVIKTTNASDVHVGDLVNFTITVTNHGPSNATGVNVTDILPVGMTFQDASNMTGYNVYNRILANGTTAVIWHIPEIPNGTSLTLWILVNVTTNKTFTNVALAVSNENATNSTNSTDITVKPSVTLLINKTANKTDVYVGDIVEYTIEISNNGPSNATGVNVSDVLDTGLKYINSTATQGVYDPHTHIWTINNITSGGTVTLKILVRILTNGTIPNVATVNCTENSTNVNASSDNITAKPQVNLTIVKTADLANVSVGDMVNFTITVTNTGLSNATNIMISDDLIAEFGYVDSNGNRTGQKVTWIIPHLANGTSASVWVQVKVNTNGTFTNVASVNCTENNTVVTSNDTNVTVNPKVNLTVIKYADIAPNQNISVGDTVKFVIVVTNNGPSNATNVIITDDLLPAFRFVSANGTYTNSSQRVTWTIAKLANGSSYMVYVIAEAVDNGFFYNIAVVNSTESENKTSNKTDVTVLPAVNLTIVKKADVKNATVGDLVNFTITVTNEGPSKASDVNVTDILPAGMEYVKSGGNVTGTSTAVANGTKVVWNIGNLTKGSYVELWVQVRVITNGTFTNVAYANSTENATGTSNGTNITVNPQVNLTIVKVSDVTAAVYAGNLVNFTITVTNKGLSNATDVVVSDVLDDAFAYVDSDGRNSGQNVTWIIPHIANGTSVSVWVQVRLLVNGTFSNVATVNCTENSTVVTSNETNVTVNPQVNLTVIKVANVNADVHVGDLINFTITVTNKGLSNATDVVVSDVLDDAFAYVDSDGRNSGQNVTWTISHIVNGTSVSVWVQVRLLTNGTFSNVATVNCTENNTVVTSNETNVTVVPKVNLTIIKVANVNADVHVGDLINFTIAVTNNGLSNATDVVISDILNDAFAYVDSDGRNSGQNVTWVISHIANGTSVSVWVQVRLLTNGTFSNVATVNCSENNTVVTSNETNVTVSPQVNLTIIKISNVNSNVLVGDLINFTITVINNGLSNATNVVVSDILDNAFEYVDSDGRNSGQNVTWTISHIANGTSANVWVQVRVLSNGTFANVATVNCTENATVVASNETNVTADPKVNLSIVKVADINNVLVGDLVNFTITVTNSGLSNATNVMVSDVLDDAFAYVDSNGNNAGQNVTWIIPHIANGTSASVWVQVRLLTNGTFSNVATVNCTENTTAITSNKTNVTVEPKVNLTVIKVSDVVAEVHVGDLINFTITVINNGLSNATNIQISDILDNAFEYVDSNGRNSGQNVTWTIGRISNGTSASVWVQVRLLTNGTFSNVATANCTENTTAVTSNVTNVTVKPTVRLIVNKTVDKTNVTIGDTVIYTVTVKNAGLSNATGIEVKENLKGSADITDSDPSKGTFANGVWNIESLAVNETATLILKVRVMAAETVENTVIAKANENGTNVSYTCDNVTVNRMDTPIRLTVQNITYGEDEIITVELPVGATGKVNITVGGTPYNDLEITPAGVVVLVVQGLSSKEYNVTASYGGDGRYASNSTNATFKVSRVVPTIKIEVEDIWYGEVEVLNVTVNAPGFVNITVNNKTITASLDKSVQTWNVLMAFNPLTYDGKATWNIENLPVGHYPVHAVYLGDENYESVSANASFNVMMLPSSVSVKAEDIFVGEPATIQVSVTPGATGNVTIDVYGRIYNAVISNGKAEIKVPGLKAGDHTVKVRYNGDDVYLPSENATTFKVKKIVPPINVDSKDIYVGDDEKITVTLPDDATGKVTITVDGKKYTSDVINGKAVFKVPGLKAGKYTVEASYSGDDKYQPVVGSDTFKVSKVKPDIDVDAPGITVGDNGDITVILPDDATGTVTIEVAGKRYTAPVKNGIARFIVPGLKVGVHDIKVWYSGDDKYLPAETTGDIDVSPVEDGPIYHAPQGLEKHATGNPILILVVVMMSMIGLGIRKFRK